VEGTGESNSQQTFGAFNRGNREIKKAVNKRKIKESRK
jgi:hypothetical protein